MEKLVFLFETTFSFSFSSSIFCSCPKNQQLLGQGLEKIKYYKDFLFHCKKIIMMFFVIIVNNYGVFYHNCQQL